jgi:hypothetical protein
MQKAWLSENGVAYAERNIVEDSDALAELVTLEVYSTPATLVDGELVVGFNRRRLEELLGLGGNPG